jgi:cytoskeletal protein RodZ
MTLEAIGSKLKSAREAQGLSLRQIYERTKIPINHLQSIDTGTPDDLPEPVYVAGFIKRYAECIGLDGQVLADEYRREESASNGNGNGKPKVAAQQVYVTPEYLKHARIDNRPPTYKLWPFYVVVIVVLMMVVSWYTTQQSNTASNPDPYNMSLKDSAAQLHQAQPGLTNPTGSGTNPAQTAAVDNDKLILSASQHVWIEVKKLATGESIFTGFLEQGDRREYADPGGLRVTAGNGGSLSAEFKGKIEAFGQAGKKTERTFEPSTGIASTDPTQTGSAATGSSSTSTAATTATKPKKVRKSTDGSPALATRRYRDLDGGSRSIYGDGGRSIDVPYRYSEGRLDAN